jgi:hypothetical protein
MIRQNISGAQNQTEVFLLAAYVSVSDIPVIESAGLSNNF